MEKRFPGWLHRHLGTRRPLPVPRPGAPNHAPTPPPWPEPGRLAPLVRAVEAGTLRPEAMEPVLVLLLAANPRPVEELVARFRPTADDARQIDSRIARVIASAHDLAGKESETLLRWAMGEVMPPLQGRVDPLRVRERLVAALEPMMRQQPRPTPAAAPLRSSAATRGAVGKGRKS